MTRRLVAAGYAIAYVPSAALVHQVSPERVRRRWLLRRGWAQGITNARLEVLGGRPLRRQRVQRAREELSGIRQHWRRRSSGEVPEPVAVARAAAAAGTCLELLRLTIRDVEPVGR
jgi:hypothetical protein